MQRIDNLTGKIVTYSYTPTAREDELEKLYYELIMAVQAKNANETRHQTALRYIREREEMRSITEECRVKESALFRRHS
jgi:hypothetical protein